MKYNRVPSSFNRRFLALYLIFGFKTIIMKQLFFILISTLSISFVNAQDMPKIYGFTKSEKFIEGNLSFNTSNSDFLQNNQRVEFKSSNLNFTPKMGYLLTDKFAFGIEFSYGNSVNQNFNNITNVIDENKNKSFGVGVFGRYYFLDLFKRFKVFSELGIKHSVFQSELNLNKVSDGNRFEAGLDLGVNFFITEKIALTFLLNDMIYFNSSRIKYTNGDQNNTTELSGNLNSINNIFNQLYF